MRIDSDKDSTLLAWWVEADTARNFAPSGLESKDYGSLTEMVADNLAMKMACKVDKLKPMAEVLADVRLP